MKKERGRPYFVILAAGGGPPFGRASQASLFPLACSRALSFAMAVSSPVDVQGPVPCVFHALLKATGTPSSSMWVVAVVLPFDDETSWKSAKRRGE